jgi:hypothetical protein
MGTATFNPNRIASLQPVVTAFHQLRLLGATLGIIEAAFGPDVPFNVALFYRRSELACCV